MYVVRKFKENYLPAWETLVNAAQIRKLELILKILEKTEPDILQGIWYHRKCRSTCAVKKKIYNVLERKNKLQIPKGLILN